MAKMKNARERRDEMQRQRMQKIRAVTQQDEALPIVAVPVSPAITDEKQGDSHVSKDQRKSFAKAAGLKSSFVLSPDRREVIMTTFGRGSTAILEKRIVDREITDLRTEQQFQVAPEGTGKYRLINGRVQYPDITADDPLYRRGNEETMEPGMDALRRKEVLERRFFGEPFQDNVHIQLIYNILDIHKIVAVASNHIVHLLNTVNGGERDFVGMLPSHIPYHELSDEKREEVDAFCRSPRLPYYSAAFYNVAPNGKAERKRTPDIYAILALMACLRNFSSHGSVAIGEGIRTPAGLYNLSKLPAEMKRTLDLLYQEAFGKLNANFLKLNTTNLICLFETLDVSDKEEQKQLTREFYRYVVFKTQKNMGFSIRKLREYMLLLPDAARAADKRYDTCRGKLYSLIDFLIMRAYREERVKRCDELVEALRESLTEEEKEAVYQTEAADLWHAMRPLFDRLMSLMTAENLKTLKRSGRLALDRAALESCLFDPKSVAVRESGAETNAEYFCRLIYLTTLFMDGKEINTLLTTLINKFENIDAFLQSMSEMGISTEFEPDYAMFARSGSVADELRVINSFALMKKTPANAKRELYRAAVTLLGAEDPDRVTDEMLQIDAETGKVLPANQRQRGAMGLRNFIANNVVESRRFQYLMRYSDPVQLHGLASNKKLVRFVLSTIPDTQIDRYCESCRQNGLIGLQGREGKEQFLTDMIAGIRFDQFRDVKQQERGEHTQKERYKAMLGLYLTVLYLAVKNLVNINARYVIAFHCMERDLGLYDGELRDRNGEPVSAREAISGDKLARQEPQYRLLTELFVQREYLKRRVCRYLSDNMAGISDYLLRNFRNAVAHLNVISCLDDYSGEMREITSYFSLYHYLMQRCLQSRASTEREVELFDKTQTYHAYCKDLVKALNTPFGYNLARYKNLSIEDLFQSSTRG